MAFRLQSVLDYREQIVEQRQQELACSEQELQRQLVMVAALQSAIKNLEQGIQARQARGALDCTEADGHLHFLRQTIEDAQKAQTQADAMAQQVEARRQALMAAMQDKQALDKLKEHSEEEERAEQLHREARNMDEIGLVRFYRQNAEGEET